MSGIRRLPAVNSTSLSDSKLQNQSAINSSLQTQPSNMLRQSLGKDNDKIVMDATQPEQRFIHRKNQHQNKKTRADV